MRFAPLSRRHFGGRPSLPPAPPRSVRPEAGRPRVSLVPSLSRGTLRRTDKYVSDPRPCGCPVARPSPRSRHGVSCIMRNRRVRAGLYTVHKNIRIRLADLPPLDASDQQMVQRPWGVDPGLSWHGATRVGHRWDRKIIILWSSRFPLQQERKQKGHLISPRRDAPAKCTLGNYSFLTFLAAGPF